MTAIANASFTYIDGRVLPCEYSVPYGLSIAKRAKSKNRMQITGSERVLREIEGM